MNILLIKKGCCNYGTKIATATGAGAKTIAFDCLNIPGAKKTGGASILNNICGARFVSSTGIAANKAISKTICSKIFSMINCFHRFCAINNWGNISCAPIKTKCACQNVAYLNVFLTQLIKLFYHPATSFHKIYI